MFQDTLGSRCALCLSSASGSRAHNVCAYRCQLNFVARHRRRYVCLLLKRAIGAGGSVAAAVLGLHLFEKRPPS